MNGEPRELTTDDLGEQEPFLPVLDEAEPVSEAEAKAIEPATKAALTRVSQAFHIESRSATLAASALQLRVRDQGSYVMVADVGRTIKALRKEIVATFKPILDAQNKACEITRTERDRHDKPLAEAEAHVKGELDGWDREQLRLVQEQQKVLDAQMAKEAMERRDAEATELELEGRDLEAAELREAPVTVAPAVIPKATPQVNGISYRAGKWKAEVVSLEQLVLAAAGEVRNPDKTRPRVAFTMLKADQVAVNKAAASMKRELAKVAGTYGLKVWEGDREVSLKA
jgi:hypothetical protein